MDEKITSWLSATVVISSTAGLAYLLRRNDEITSRMIFSAVLNSAVTGVIIFFLLHDTLNETPMRLVGVSSLAGAGGGSILDLLLTLLRRRVSKEQ